MKQLCFFLLLAISSLSAQEYSSVDDKIKKYPQLITVDKLANKIATDFTSDLDKVRAVFTWLSFNIKYNLKEFYNPTQKRVSFKYRNEEEKQAKIKAIKHTIVKNTLSNRSAVCEGYAQTFSKVCTLLNIENEVIKGYARNSYRDIGKTKKRANHAWNAVKIDNKWLYIDATWAAGAVTNGSWQRNFNDYYFDIPKEKYFFTHFPEDSLWQLRVNQMTLQDFFNQPIYSSDFLKRNYQLLKPTSGTILRKSDGSITFMIKNINENQSIYCGFKGSKYMKRTKISFDKNIATISIIPPTNNKEVFLIIDNNVVLEHLLK